MTDLETLQAAALAACGAGGVPSSAARNLDARACDWMSFFARGLATGRGESGHPGQAASNAAVAALDALATALHERDRAERDAAIDAEALAARQRRTA